MMYARTRAERSQFRKIPFGAPYFLATNLATAPTIKYSRRASLGGWSTSTGRPTTTAVADTSVAVVKVPRVILIKRGSD